MTNPLPATSISVYVPNPSAYVELQNSIRKQWFNKYGQALTKSEVIIKAMLFLNEYLSSENTSTDNSKHNSIRISRIIK